MIQCSGVTATDINTEQARRDRDALVTDCIQSKYVMLYRIQFKEQSSSDLKNVGEYSAR